MSILINILAFASAFMIILYIGKSLRDMNDRIMIRKQMKDSFMFKGKIYPASAIDNLLTITNFKFNQFIRTGASIDTLKEIQAEIQELENIKRTLN